MKKLLFLVMAIAIIFSVMSCNLRPKYDYDVWVDSYVDENYMIVDRYTYDSSGVLISSNLDQYVYDGTFHYKWHECREAYLHIKLYIECWWYDNYYGEWYWESITINSYLNQYNLSETWSLFLYGPASSITAEK